MEPTNIKIHLKCRWIWVQEHNKVSDSQEERLKVQL
jgi:hypothetical protein